MNVGAKTDPSILAGVFDFSAIVESVEQIIRMDEWCKNFKLDEDDRHTLEGLLAEHMVAGEHQPNAFYELVILGVKFVKETTRTYLEAKQHYYREMAIQGIQPLKAEKLTPADCPALKTWPDGRLPANGISGRLENAGQFFRRLLKQGLYDEKIYGKLYLHDLRQINPKLYLALTQWQTRYKEVLLEGKRAEMADLDRQDRSGEATLSFTDKARLSNARWRQRKQHMQ